MSIIVDTIAKDKICSVTLNEITDSYWMLHGFNLRISNVIAPKTKFQLISSGKDNTTYSVNVSTSSFGHIKASNGFHIIMINCLANGNTRLTLTLIEIVDCNLNIANSKFLNQIKYFKGPAIINAVRSQIYIKNTNISKNCALDGLICTSKIQCFLVMVYFY